MAKVQSNFQLCQKTVVVERMLAGSGCLGLTSSTGTSTSVEDVLILVLCMVQ